MVACVVVDSDRRNTPLAGNCHAIYILIVLAGRLNFGRASALDRAVVNYLLCLVSVFSPCIWLMFRRRFFTTLTGGANRSEYTAVLSAGVVFLTF